MNIKNAEIARRYAAAFLNIYVDKIDKKKFLNIKKMFEFLEVNPGVISFFYLPNISLSDINKSINILLNKFDLPTEFNQLANLLIKHGRILLFTDVLRHIVWLYQEKTGYIFFEITSGTSLQESDLKLIIKFLEEKTSKQIIENYKVDKSLIAGIRAQSDNFLWECSIRKQLQNLNRLLI